MSDKMKNIPKLRFPQFVNSGEWGKKTLKEIQYFRLYEFYVRNAHKERQQNRQHLHEKMPFKKWRTSNTMYEHRLFCSVWDVLGFKVSLKDV